jgi:hypothetical protein
MSGTGRPALTKPYSVRVLRTMKARRTSGVLICCTVGLVLVARSSEAQDKPTRACDVGAYLISLRDFDLARGSFAADFWFWSTCPSADLKPLEVMDFVNAIQVQTRLPSTSERSGKSWSYVKVSGVFHHQWRAENYPFDRHVLTVVLENTNAPASEFTYTPDTAGSKPSRDIVLDGWRITDYRIERETYVYDTTFGDPAFDGKTLSDYSRLIVSIAIERTKRLSFFTLVAGVYVAVALSSITFLLGPYNGRRRTNMLAGTLFAVLVNQRVAESVIGRTEQVTLLDQIHILAMIYIFAIALAGIYAQQLHDSGAEKEAGRWDKRGFWVTLSSYIVFNVLLVTIASLRG